MSVFRNWARTALVVVSMFGGSALGQELAAAALERVKVRSTVQPLGPAPFGETINLYTGSLSFTHTDVDYPGTGPTILLTRSFDTQTRFVQSYKFFGDWTFDIPRIETIVRRPGIRSRDAGHQVERAGALIQTRTRAASRTRKIEGHEACR